MKLLPLLQFVESPDGTRWAVVFAGGFAAGRPHRLIFSASGKVFTAEYASPPESLTPKDILALLEFARKGRS